MTDPVAAGDRGAPLAPLRVLLLGGHGRLGSAIAARLAAQAPGGAHIELLAPRRHELALDPDAPADTAARWFAHWRPEVVVNCIALTDVDRCEREPGAARQLNAALPGALAREAAAGGARLIHFSTDYVFDGALRRPYREDDAPNPLSVYGATKLDGDRAIADSGCRHWIFRISWLYGAPRRNVSAMLLERAGAGRTLRLANDRLGVPNPVQLVAREVADCIARDAAIAGAAGLAPSGLYHLSARGATSWYDFGVAFVREAIRAGRLAAQRAPHLEGFAEAALARPAKRPQYSALDPSRYEATFGRAMPGWEEAISLAL
ncbi:MAG: dTDP-4-dehydrorhamnose reductase [Burkholderiaceae bacterium]|nr:dTDP-4-dehydrorhamnose reductase [Burkholderiaceae bacterium]